MNFTDDIIRLELFADGPFQGLTTPAEFAELIGVEESTIRHAIKAGRLKPGIDCMKFGKQWVMAPHAFVVMDRYNGYGKYYDIMKAYNSHPERGKAHDTVNDSDNKAGD